MTFPVPSVAGVFLSLSNRLKTAITDGSAAHYLLGRTPTRLRNHLGFHAALAEMADALLERAVLPYQITSSLSSLTVLPTAQFSGRGNQDPPVQVYAKIDLPRLLATAAMRSMLGTEKRYAPLEFWRAIFDGINSLSSSQPEVLWPRDAASEDYADVVIYPSICRTIGSFGEYGNLVDLYDSGWDTTYNLYLYDVVPKEVHDLVFHGWDRGYQTAYMLSKLIFDFAYETELWSRIFGYLHLKLIDADPSSPSIVGNEQIPSLPVEKAVALIPWSPMEAATGQETRKPTARPNIDLLRIYQILLGCFWANWAKMKVEVKVPHLVTTRTVVYSVDWFGSLTNESDSTTTSVTTSTNKLEWSHDVSWSTDGEWSNSGVYGGTVRIDFYMSELLYDVSAVDAAVADAQQLIDDAYAAYVQAENTWNTRKSELDSASNNAFSNIPTSARDQFAADLMSNVNNVDGLTYINSITLYANGRYVNQWIFWPIVYLPMSSDQAKSVFDRFKGEIQRSSAVEDANGNLTFVIQGGYSFGISVPEVAAASRAISNARQAERSAWDAMNSAYSDYEQVVASHGTTAQDGVCIDITNKIRDMAAGCFGSIVWNGDEPKTPASQSQYPVRLTVVSTEEHPIVGSGANALRALLMIGGYGTRTSPWPASSLISGSYVKSEKTAIGARLKDDYFDTEDIYNNGYYNYREISGEPSEGESRYRATRNANGSGDKAPSGNTFRRLMVDGSFSPSQENPSNSVEYVVGSLIGSPTDNVSTPTVGGVLPLMLYGIHAFGRGGSESTDDWTSGLGPFYAWYHPDKSPKVYVNGSGQYHYQGPNDSSPVPSGYSFTGKYCPWRITGLGGYPVYWNWDDNGYPAYLECNFSYTDDAYSQSGSAATPPHHDRLVVDLSRHLAVRAEWNWKSMPVTHN